MNRGVFWAFGLAGLAVVWSTCAHQPSAPAKGAGPGVAVVTNSGAGGAGPPARVVVSTEPPDLTFWRGRKDLITAPPPPVPAELPLPHVARWKLPNGLDVVAVPRDGLPIVSFSLAIKAGAYDEQKDRTQGVSDFTAGMLRHGAGKRSAEQIAGRGQFVRKCQPDDRGALRRPPIKGNLPARVTRKTASAGKITFWSISRLKLSPIFIVLAVSLAR